jgi:hypothetical protein
MFRIMKTSNFLYALLTLTLIVIISGCKKDPPVSPWDPNATFGAQPIVSSVVPENMPYILGGVTTIDINGTGFPTDTSKIHLFFNNTEVSIGSITATQIKLLAPIMILDSIRVRLRIDGSDQFSDLKYINIRSTFTLIKEIDTTQVTPHAITFNKNGDLFVSVTKGTVSDGIYEVTAAGSAIPFAAKGTEPSFTGLKLKGDSIYAARGANRIVSRNSTPPYAMNIFSSALPAIVVDFDYDANRIMWTGGSTMNGGILRIDSLKSVKQFPFTGTIRSVRVFNGALYVTNEAPDSTNAIYKIPIIASDSSLGTAEKYFDLSVTVGNKKNKAYGITFDSDGNLYVGTDAPAGIYVVASDKSIQPLYNGVIGPNCTFLAWGNDSYLYVVREKATATSSPTGLFKIDMLGKLSAPYYGQ